MNRKEALARANALAALPWVRHTAYHWSIKVGYKTAHYWPSTQKFRWNVTKRGVRSTLTGVKIETAEQWVNDAAPKPLRGDIPYFVCTASFCPNGGPPCNKHDCPQERL